MPTSTDAYLGGRVQINQPHDGYRAGTDPVLLAAGCPAQAGQSVLDVGCGVGVAALCLGRRVAGANLFGLEVNADIAMLASENVIANNIPFDVLTGDLFAPSSAFLEMSFDHVITNPPFFDARTVTTPKNEQKAQSFAMDAPVKNWVLQSMKRLRPKGSFTMINRIEALPDMLAAIASVAGEIRILPLAARTGRPAKRVIIRAIKGSRGIPELLPPFCLHEGASHDEGKGYSAPAEAILRSGKSFADLEIL